MEAKVVDAAQLHQTTVEVKRPRHSYSCPACRKDKKPCNFSGKEWNETHRDAECDRCVKKSRQCGTPTRILRKSKALIDQNSAAGAQVTHDGAEHEEEQRQPRTEQNKQPDQRKNLSAYNLPRPIDAAWGVVDPPRPHTSLEHLPKLLGDILATREYVRSMQFACEDAQQWRGGNCDLADIEAQLMKLEADLNKLFKRTWITALSPSVPTLANESWRRDLEPFGYRFLCRKERFILSSPNNDMIGYFKRLNDEQFARKRETCYYSEADHMCHNICSMMDTCDPPHHIASGQELLGLLSKATSAIAQVMEQVTVGNSYGSLSQSSRDTRPAKKETRAIPFAHLALLQADDPAVLERFRQNPHLLLEEDALRRTVVHLAAYFQRLPALRQILGVIAEAGNGNIVSQILPDILGLLPHQIAACKDDVEGFKLIMEHGANPCAADTTVNDKPGTCLDLAVHNGSVKVVSFILFMGSGDAACYNPFETAVRQKQFSVVEVLAGYYKSQRHNKPQFILDAARLAHEYERVDIANRLKEVYDIQVSLSSRNTAIGSLESLCYEDQMLQPPVINHWPRTAPDVWFNFVGTPGDMTISSQQIAPSLMESFDGISPDFQSSWFSEEPFQGLEQYSLAQFNQSQQHDDG